jgi:hypothetical protein
MDAEGRRAGSAAQDNHRIACGNYAGGGLRRKQRPRPGGRGRTLHFGPRSRRGDAGVARSPSLNWAAARDRNGVNKVFWRPCAASMHNCRYTGSRHWPSPNGDLSPDV